MADTKDQLKAGRVDIVIGTHALLAKSLEFAKLGLLIVDEEQHFGVVQKERLKEMRGDIHVLTLTATPIPRTLQLALSNIREMSLITTPPVDRLAVRTFVLPYDPVIVREAIMREHFRGGQIFYVCPRIEDLDTVAARLRSLVPEIKFVMAHGRMSPTALEKAMNAFYDGSYELLLATNIIESGLDIPTANTMVIHRADMFGLAQLYQLRGRIGRSKLRGYAYLTTPPGKALTETAQRRLEVMQTLDQLGAGFTLASHDLDIRGAGNLLGDEQSGHVREVGVELYQHLLEEAVREARGTEKVAAQDWTPQINIGMPVLIPESYVQDLNVRLGLYRRLADLADRAGDRRLRGRADRPLRPAAGGGGEPAAGRGVQAAVPVVRRRAAGDRAQGRRDRVQGQPLRAAGEAGRVHQQAADHRDAASRPSPGLSPGLGRHQGAHERRQEADAEPGRDGGLAALRSALEVTRLVAGIREIPLSPSVGFAIALHGDANQRRVDLR